MGAQRIAGTSVYLMMVESDHILMTVERLSSRRGSQRITGTWVVETKTAVSTSSINALHERDAPFQVAAKWMPPRHGHLWSDSATALMADQNKERLFGRKQVLWSRPSEIVKGVFAWFQVSLQREGLECAGWSGLDLLWSLLLLLRYIFYYVGNNVCKLSPTIIVVAADNWCPASCPRALLLQKQHGIFVLRQQTKPYSSHLVGWKNSRITMWQDLQETTARSSMPPTFSCRQSLHFEYVRQLVLELNEFILSKVN